jgi:hypothetical protein
VDWYGTTELLETWDAPHHFYYEFEKDAKTKAKEVAETLDRAGIPYGVWLISREGRRELRY